MSSTLNRRLAALEQRQAPPDGPQVIRLVFMKPKGEPSTDEDFRLAFIIGRSPDRPGCQLSREDGETVAAFLERVEVERFRVYGPAA